MLSDTRQQSSAQSTVPPLLQTGFRPFFLGAMIYAIVSMAIWMSQTSGYTVHDLQSVDAALWHGHEMIFGYSIAVIAGFLLTAVQNWTGNKTAQGTFLFLLFVLWLETRLLSLAPDASMLPAIIAISSVFYALLMLALCRPLIKAGNNAQWGILSKVVLIWLMDITFVAAAHGWLETSLVRPVLLVAVYTVIGLILVMAQRVVPSFTKNAIDDASCVKEFHYLPLLSLISFIAFVIADIAAWKQALLYSGITAFAVNAVRLFGWHSREIWSKPLVWVLHLALWFITLGIIMRAVADSLGLQPSLGLHAMTYGGIGLITTGMMARVALGHTGRNVFAPSSLITLVFLLLSTGAGIRVLIPVIWSHHYATTIIISQALWILAFLLLLLLYLKPLLTARIDGRYG